MTIYLAVDVEREEGKTMSNELVGEALADEVNGIGGFDVEDSVYGVLTVEAVEGPKAASSSGLTGQDWLAMDDAFKAFAAAFPPRLGPDDPDQFANLTDAQRTFMLAFGKLAFSTRVGQAVTKAKAAAYKAAQKKARS